MAKWNKEQDRDFSQRAEGFVRLWDSNTQGTMASNPAKATPRNAAKRITLKRWG